MRLITSTILLLSLLLTGCTSQEVKQEFVKNDAKSVKGEAEYLPAKPSDRASQLIKRTAYTLSYNKEWVNCNWVYWKLTREHCNGKNQRQNEKFTEDNEVKGSKATHQDYVQSGYDRGHMCPAADNSFSDELMKESFYMSNICPQNRSLNAGDWSELEDQCRQWAQDYPYPLHIVAGPIFDTPNYTTIGQAGRPQIAVPDRFYKVLLTVTPTGARTLGFIYPNEACNQDIRSYCVSVDEVERITGIDFFHTLEDDVENVVERECNPGRWGI